MSRIKINCESCGKQHDVRRDKEAPASAISMGCNWCPDCEDKADDYYYEWYNYNDDDDSTNCEPEYPKQFMLFSIADEIIDSGKSDDDVVLNEAKRPQAITP